MNKEINKHQQNDIITLEFSVQKQKYFRKLKIYLDVKYSNPA
jgi:hypothetical protein